MKIDSHQHFWQFDASRDTWIDESMESIKRDFLPLDLEPLLNERSFDGTVAVQASESNEETYFLLSLAQQYLWIKKVVGWVDLCSSSVSSDLDKYADEKKLTGFRQVLQDLPPSVLKNCAFRNGIAQLEKYGFTYDLLIYPKHLGAACDLVESFPDQLFVVDHLAKPRIKEGTMDGWKEGIERIAKFENVYCKLSGMVTEADRYSWSDDDLQPFMDVIFEQFGTERVMFGSDWPVALLAASFGDTVDVVANYIKRFSEEEQSQVMGGAACRFYNIDPLSWT